MLLEKTISIVKKEILRKPFLIIIQRFFFFFFFFKHHENSVLEKIRDYLFLLKKMEENEAERQQHLQGKEVEENDDNDEKDEEGRVGREGEIHSATFLFCLKKSPFGKNFLKNANMCACLTPVLNERLDQF